MSTDLNLSPLDIIRIHGLRFKIEVSFKQALRVIGAYACHFRMGAMDEGIGGRQLQPFDSPRTARALYGIYS